MAALESRVGLQRAEVAHGSVVDEPFALAAGRRRGETREGPAKPGPPSDCAVRSSYAATRTRSLWATTRPLVILEARGARVDPSLEGVSQETRKFWHRCASPKCGGLSLGGEIGAAAPASSLPLPG
jgi:hypothetical protein